jgi:hypothetical protein
MSDHLTRRVTLAGPYVRRTRAQRFVRFMHRLVRYLAGPRP